METDAQRAQLVKLSGERCARGGSRPCAADRVGKRTKECAYRTPVVGRDLEIAAIGAAARAARRSRSSARPSWRSTCGPGAPARYQLAVFPLQRKAQLRKVLSRRQDQVPAHREEGARTSGAQQGQRAAPARLQRHQRPRKGQLHSSPTSAASSSPTSPTGGGRTAGPRSRLLGRRAGNAKGAVGQLRRRRRPRPQPLLAAPSRIMRGDVDDDVEKPRRRGPGSGLGGDWRVIVCNDNHNTFEHVAADAGPGAARRHRRPGPRRSPSASTTAARRSSGPARASPPSTTGSSSSGGPDDGPAGARR